MNAILNQREDQGLEKCRVWDLESRVNVTERGRGLSDINVILNQREIEKEMKDACRILKDVMSQRGEKGIFGLYAIKTREN